jgi:hypothetical protein
LRDISELTGASISIGYNATEWQQNGGHEVFTSFKEGKLRVGNIQFLRNVNQSMSICINMQNEATFLSVDFMALVTLEYQ